MGEHPWENIDNKSEKHQCSWDRRGREKSEKECLKSREETREGSRRREGSSESTSAKK